MQMYYVTTSEPYVHSDKVKRFSHCTTALTTRCVRGDLIRHAAEAGVSEYGALSMEEKEQALWGYTDAREPLPTPRVPFRLKKYTHLFRDREAPATLGDPG